MINLEILDQHDQPRNLGGYKQNNDAFIVKVADELEDSIKLLEIGFEYHLEITGHKVFRKRK